MGSEPGCRRRLPSPAVPLLLLLVLQLRHPAEAHHLNKDENYRRRVFGSWGRVRAREQGENGWRGAAFFGDWKRSVRGFVMQTRADVRALPYGKKVGDGWLGHQIYRTSSSGKGYVRENQSPSNNRRTPLFTATYQSPLNLRTLPFTAMDQSPSNNRSTPFFTAMIQSPLNRRSLPCIKAF